MFTEAVNLSKELAHQIHSHNTSNDPTIDMAKRQLGLGKKNKTKKQKVDSDAPKDAVKGEKDSDDQLLTVELTNEVNPDDPMSQLLGLWQTWKESERSNELILNGIINECDRILRNCKENGGDEDVEIDNKFYSTYSQALSEAAKFKSEEESGEWIANALERIAAGHDKFGKHDVRLLFAKCDILLNKIAVEYIGKMNVDSKKEEFSDLTQLFEDFIHTWNKAIKESEKSESLAIFEEDFVFEILNTFDDLLDIIDKFGTQMNEVVDSDDDDDDEEDADVSAGDKNPQDALEASDFQISEDHPLYEIQQEDKYNAFWRDNMLKYKELLGDNVDKKLIKSVNEKLGQSFLMEAEEPIAFFSSYQYDTEEEDDEEEDNADIKEAVEAARQDGLKLVDLALQHLRQTHDEEDPKSWVNIAEALITYGNLLELESEEQEAAYKEAEKLLRRANNATHGHYEDILHSLVQ